MDQYLVPKIKSNRENNEYYASQSSYQIPDTKSRQKYIGCFMALFTAIISLCIGFFALALLTSRFFDISHNEPISKTVKQKQHITPTLSPEKVLQEKQRTEAEQDLFGIYNNYDYFYNLSPSQERNLGVFPLPDDAKRVTTIRGIGMYETICRPFKENEIQLLTKFLAKLPQDFLDTQPKGIVSSCLDALDLEISENTTGVASGPFLYIGNEFFGYNDSLENLSENDMLQTFMHEYAHILQYYYTHQYWIDQNVPVVIDLEDVSTLTNDFAPRVGWYQETKENGSPSFFKLNDGDWKLKDDPESQKTTQYAKDNGPTEDFAESFALVIAGQPQMLSEPRSSYITNFLGNAEMQFTNGIVPQYPGSNLVFFDIDEYFQSELDVFGKRQKHQKDLYQWSVDKSTGVNNLIAYYAAELPVRGFGTETPLTLKTGPLGKDEYAYGVYTFDDIELAVIILGAKTIGSQIEEYPQYTTTRYNQIVTPDYYLISIIEYE